MSKDKNNKSNKKKNDGKGASSSFFGLFHSSKEKKTDEVAREKKPYDENAVHNIIAPYAIAFLGIFLIAAFIFSKYMSIVGMIASSLLGLFGIAMWLVPLVMFFVAANWKNDAPKGHVKLRFICMGICLIFLSALMTLVIMPDISEGVPKGYSGMVVYLWETGKTFFGGGVVGGLFYLLLEAICGKVGCGIITGFVTVIFIFLIFGITLGDVVSFIGRKIKSFTREISDAHAQKMEERSAGVENGTKTKPKFKARKGSSVEELCIEDNDEDTDIELNPGDKSNIVPTPGETPGERDFLADFLTEDEDTAPVGIGVNNIPSGKNSGSDIDDIFCEDAVIEGSGSAISAKDLAGKNLSGDDNSEDDEDIPFDIDSDTDVIEADVPAPEDIYEFPPIDFLPGNPNPSVFKVTEELTETAKNLVTTLANFNVRTKVMNISCGPTVTRFELKPEVGVKVRSIQNLADDIALHLRASSVRIEAPIPGKDAVGIEIPNKTVSTVFIRELIDSEEFRNLPSKLSVALGMDVSGAPVYMDIAKMPHLLIAGATGMGKSVCINSFIVSVLYKARPDEVKLILIDPKKVEFAMYDSIPHLLVPVVTDPKKAAGSLAWAVNEMEHRFNLIEAAKCRDIKSYNAVCEKDSRFKKMSQIVIIIDELADLMMTARDEVETSICRLAQKARAAGMHLIIGTQRPSVDVITGVIKANVPSRIAFTVASQVDSRTILDVVGAENLVGKGDMLFAPVGCMKPTRVQGSFVGPDSVIEEITGFLRTSGIQAYDDEIQNAIELEAMKCAEKKKGKGAGDGAETYVGSTDGFERDEMMLPALELGVDMGQISTSLVQRKLSLGYARAPRIVDMLSDMGFVGPFEGSKPRKVLITREEFLELKMKQDNYN